MVLFYSKLGATQIVPLAEILERSWWESGAELVRIGGEKGKAGAGDSREEK